MGFWGNFFAALAVGTLASFTALNIVHQRIYENLPEKYQILIELIRNAEGWSRTDSRWYHVSGVLIDTHYGTVMWNAQGIGDLRHWDDSYKIPDRIVMRVIRREFRKISKSHAEQRDAEAVLAVAQNIVDRYSETK